METSQRARHRRNRRRSMSPASPVSAIREREYYQRRMENIAAGSERRSRMTPEDKTAETGLQLQRQLDSEPSLTLLLQPSPPGHMTRARCRARYCAIAEEAGELEIRDDYRIVLTSHERIYFHVTCLENTLDLPSLAPKRFKLDAASYRWNDNWPWTWGLMLREWFAYGGCIDLGKIAEYIQNYERYEEEGDKFDTIWIDWQLDHQRKCNDDKESCQCSSPPQAPIAPILKDYKTDEGDTCPLNEVLQHQLVENLAPAISVEGFLARPFH